MFTIDFTKPFLYKDIIYFNQGSLAANNILRCKLLTGGDETLEGCIATVTFKTLSHSEINGIVNMVDAKNCIVDIKFPSNALEVGVNELEVILTKGEGIDKVVTPSPIIKYEVWQCITTGNGIQGDSNYPILIDLISDVNNAVRIANNASTTADVSLKQTAKMLEVVNTNISKANEAIDNTNSAKDKALNAVEEVNLAKDNLISEVNEAIEKMNNDFEALTASQQQDAEVILARDGEVNLNARLERDLYIDGKSLKQEVLDLGVLKESQEMSYSTDRGYLVCKETKKGTIKDLKISGKSLVNIFKISRSDKNDTKLFHECDRNTGITFKGINVTIFNPTGKKVIFDIRSSNTGNWVRSIIMNTNEISKYVTLTEDEYIGYIYGQVVDGWVSSSEELQKLKGCCVVITDNYTQNPPSYFEGIASIGTGVNEIEVSSYNANILDVENFLKLSNGYTYNNGTYTIISNTKMFSEGYKINHFNSLTFACKVRIVDKMTNFRLCFIYTDGTFNESNMTSSTTEFVQLTLTSVKGKIVDKIACNWTTAGTFEARNWQLTLTDSYTNDIASKKDKKPLLFKDTDNTWKPIEELRGLNTVCDTVECGRYFNRVGKQAITENITLNTQYTSLDYIAVPKPVDSIFYNNYNRLHEVITDTNFKQWSAPILNWDTADLIGSFSTAPTQKDIWFGVEKGTTLEQAKQMLVGKNIMYQLAEEKVFEVNPLFLEAYEGETMAKVNSGVVNALIEFKITSYITNLVLLNQQRIKELENELYKTNLANFTVALNTLDTKLKLEQLTKTPK